jgi:predicted PurR-regulated permease PerM
MKFNGTILIMSKLKISFDINNLLLVAIFLSVLAMVYQIRGLLLILLAAVVVASFAEGIVEVGKKIHFPRVVSVVLFYLVMISLFGGALVFIVPVLVDELGSLSKYYPDIAHLVENGKLIQQITNQEIPVTDLITNQNSTIAQKIFSNISIVFGGLVNVIILLVVSFYLSVQEGGMERFIRILVPLRHEEYAIDLWRRTRIKISAWFKGQLLLAIILAIFTYLSLAIVGMPYALLLALLAGLFGMIPYGILLALIPAVGIAMIHGGWEFGLIVLFIYWIIQQITDFVIQPLILRKLTGLPSLIVILSVIIAANLAGIIGIIIAVPIAVFILEMVNDLENSKKQILAELEAVENQNSYIPILDLEKKSKKVKLKSELDEFSPVAKKKKPKKL